jgi:hypothetical protein
MKSQIMFRGEVGRQRGGPSLERGVFGESVADEVNTERRSGKSEYINNEKYTARLFIYEQAVRYCHILGVCRDIKRVLNLII